jgi:NeuD_NnaD: sugar O-acyltransferase, sialic acid O-acetyltransferase NeuD family
LWSCWEGYNRK